MCLSNLFEKDPFLVKFPIIIDVNNVVYECNNGQNKPILNDFLLMREHLLKIGFSKDQIFCICDPKLRYNIDKKNEIESLIDDGLIKPAPAGKKADEFILSLALTFPFCFVVSNDIYREYIDQLPSKEWLFERKITFMFLGEKVCLSPNIAYDKVDELQKSERIEPIFKENPQKKTQADSSINNEREESPQIEKINNDLENPKSTEKQTTTLDVLKRMEQSQGELNLF